MKKMAAHNNRKNVFLSGDEAIARGAYEAGLKFAASYPGTPATEILEHLAGFDEVDSQWSVNEKIAYEVALAASIAGARSLFAAKHVGINVAMDPLMISAYTGINAGFVVVSADDPGLHSSQSEQDNRYIARFAGLPMLEPSSPYEAYMMTKEAFEMSEEYDLPVMIRITTRIAHTKENFDVSTRKDVPNKKFKVDASKYVMVPKNATVRHKELHEKLARLEKFSDSFEFNRAEMNSKRAGIITTGVSYLYCKEMYPDFSYLKIGLSNPLPKKMIRKFSETVDVIYVVEELEPFMQDQIAAMGIRPISKYKSFCLGELKPEYIPLIIEGKEKPYREQKEKRPVLCPGCPHINVFTILKKLKVTVTGDIGCYTLAYSAPFEALHTQLDMGSGATFLEGFSKILGEKIVGVIGDSTFVHSGVPGLIDMAYNKTNAVLIILDNGTTAMTGNQPHPAVGITLKGKITKKLILEDLCKACGADNVDVVACQDTEKLEELIKQRLNEKKLSVIIARQPCVLLEKRK
ncbi:MAG: thiamine pyrophosphate-dependent enzyme [Candidatus Margulisiibacteriota bacterium]